MHEAQTLLDEFRRVNHDDLDGVDSARASAIVTWQPPPSHMIKINWNAGINLREGRVGLDLIARDSNGNFLAARSMSLAIRTEPTSVKALVAVNAIIFYKELGFDNTIFEGDSLQVVKAIASKGPCFSSYGQFIECIQRELRVLKNACFRHVMRDANCAAHTLVKLSTTHVTMTTWLGDMFHLVWVILYEGSNLFYSCDLLFWIF